MAAYLPCGRAAVCALQALSHLTLPHLVVFLAQLQNKLREERSPEAPGNTCDRGRIPVMQVWLQSPCSETQKCYGC